MNVSTLKRSGKPDLAYVYSAGAEPLLMFCGGYRSDMQGTKATWLEERCRARGQAYLRFDYGGHGQSAGLFEDCTIGSWADDAADILSHINPESVIIIGSSMGGWIALLLAERFKEIAKALIGINAAPDFTDDMFDKLSPDQKIALKRDGFVKVPNQYSDEPYHYSQDFYDESKAHYLLDAPRTAPCKMRMFQGLADNVVLPEHAAKIQEIYEGDIETIYVEGADHSLSRPADLELIDDMVKSVSAL
ncbi:MAG: alpha/beta hydrolase [Micavibrio sp.]|nr:alpha/beta hydrolase [Micavibrio sp.]